MVDSCPLIVAGAMVNRTAVVVLRRLHCLAAVREWMDGWSFLFGG